MMHGRHLLMAEVGHLCTANGVTRSKSPRLNRGEWSATKSGPGFPGPLRVVPTFYADRGRRPATTQAVPTSNASMPSPNSSPTGEPVNGNRLAAVPSTDVSADDDFTPGGCRVNVTPDTHA